MSLWMPFPSCQTDLSECVSMVGLVTGPGVTGQGGLPSTGRGQVRGNIGKQLCPVRVLRHWHKLKSGVLGKLNNLRSF